MKTIQTASNTCKCLGSVETHNFQEQSFTNTNHITITTLGRTARFTDKRSPPDIFLPRWTWWNFRILLTLMKIIQTARETINCLGSDEAHKFQEENADPPNTLHITTTRGGMTRFTGKILKRPGFLTLLVISSSVFGKSATAKRRTFIEIYLRNWMHQILRYLFSDCTGNLTEWIWKTFTGGIARLPA
jgi:hypothetical protein